MSSAPTRDSRRDEKGRRRAPASLLAGIVGRIETAPGLDRVGVPLGAGLHRLLRPGPAVDALSGKALGHPAHPALVSAPIGCWTGALVADLAGEPRAGRVLTGLGVLSALPVAATGASDWADTTGAEQRVGVVHLGLNLAATVLYAASWWARRRDQHHLGVGVRSGRSGIGHGGRMAGRPPGLRAGRRRRHQRLRWRPHRMDGRERSIRRFRAGQQRHRRGQ